jgi:hypothetical protein
MAATNLLYTFLKGMIIGYKTFAYFAAHFDLPGRAVRCLPAPAQTRTSGFPAYGSSIYGFAYT